MGVTIHFSGKLRSRGDLAEIGSIATKWAATWKCEVIDVDEPMKELIRVRNGEVCIYESPVTGMLLCPHPKAEPLFFEFDSDGYMAHFCKTQFAPVQVHVEIIGLLREMAPHLEDFSVLDEGGYWDSGDRRQLEEKLALLQRLIDAVGNNDGALIAPLVKEALEEKDRPSKPGYSLN